MPLPDVYDMEYDQNRLGRMLAANQGGQSGIARGANRLGMLLGGGNRRVGQDAFLRGQVEGATTAEKMAQAQLVRNKLIAQESFAQRLEDSGVPHAQAIMYATAMQGGYNPHELMSARNTEDLMARRAEAIKTGTDPTLPGGAAAMTRMAPYLAGMHGQVVMPFRTSGGVTTNEMEGTTTLDQLGEAHKGLLAAQTGLEGLRGETERQRADAEKALAELRRTKSGAAGPAGGVSKPLTTEQMKGAFSTTDDKGIPRLDPAKVRAFDQFRALRGDTDPDLANATSALEAFQSQYGSAPGQPGEEDSESEMPPGSFGVEAVTSPQKFTEEANRFRRYPPQRPRSGTTSPNPTPGVATPPTSTQPFSFMRPSDNAMGNAMTAAPSAGSSPSVSPSAAAAAPTAGGHAQPTTKAQYDALPSGTTYIDANGNVRRKR